MKESLKPIEPGCLAMVVHSDHPLIVATVREKYPTRDRCHECGRHNSYWRIDGENTERWHYCLCVLIRIDPDEEIHKDEEMQDELDKLDAVLRKAGVWEE